MAKGRKNARSTKADGIWVSQPLFILTLKTLFVKFGFAIIRRYLKK